MERVLKNISYTKTLAYDYNDEELEYELSDYEEDEFIEHILIKEYKLDKELHKDLIDDLLYSDEFSNIVFERFEDEAIEYFRLVAYDYFRTQSLYEIENDAYNSSRGV